MCVFWEKKDTVEKKNQAKRKVLERGLVREIFMAFFESSWFLADFYFYSKMNSPFPFLLLLLLSV